jgi:hypothetical protein
LGSVGDPSPLDDEYPCLGFGVVDFVGELAEPAGQVVSLLVLDFDDDAGDAIDVASVVEPS